MYMYEEEYVRRYFWDRLAYCRLCGPEGARPSPPAERKRKEE